MAELLTLEQEAKQLAKQLFDDDSQKCARFTSRLLDICSKVQGKDILLIHNPGGWGTTHLENLLQWERSIVEGVSATIENLGYNWFLMQYFRTNKGWHAIMGDIREQYRFFASKANIMAAELGFITQHFVTLQVVMIGVSQGAAFNNAVSQYLGVHDRVFSIELGIPFPYKSKRVLTEKTLVLDSNGLMPDALMEWDVPTIVKTYVSAPFRWLKYRLQGKRVKFTYCINLPGHDYNWDYPEVQRQTEEFLNLRFGVKNNTEVEA
ncbi:MAG: hypothetical protein QGI51_06205 [Dehalococcoidales bacterium]|jgi:hypothetical protein|nr:hypothetical protein [Dehalococcoidales bacterium]